MSLDTSYRERRLADRMQDEEFRAAYELAAKEIAPPKCPRCGSEDIEIMRPEETTWHTCRSCGYEFVDENDVPETDPAKRPT